MPSHLGHGMHVPYLDRGPKAFSDYHTLTNLPFKTRPKLSTRYDYVARPSSVNLPFVRRRTKRDASSASPVASEVNFVDDDSAFNLVGVEYANFLRENERTIGPVGFIDSTRYNHTFSVRGQTVPAPSTGVAALRRSHKPYPTVTALAAKTAYVHKEFDKRMKVIEDHMWQHKQEERELKRVEGDVLKRKRVVQRTLKEYETSMSKKVLDEEKRLNQALEQNAKVKVEATHSKEERTKQRIDRVRGDKVQGKNKLRKNVLVITDAERQYKSKLMELEMRKEEITKLSDDFENKLKRKENETYNITKELAELAIEMNMEAIKGKSTDFNLKREERVNADKYIRKNRQLQERLDKKLAKGDGIHRGAENRRRQHSASFEQQKEHLSEHIREGDRKLTDNKNMMTQNIENQKKLKEIKDAEKFNKKKTNFELNVEEHVARKQDMATKLHLMKRRIGQERAENWEKTYDRNFKEFKRRRNEDLLRTFQRIVHRDNEMGHQLYQKCRQLDFNRKSQEQALRKSEDKLIKSRAKNTGKIRETVAEVNRAEHEASNKTKKLKAELMQAQNQRSTAEYTLQKFRGVARESEYVYNEIDRENKRLMKIGARSDSYLEQQAMPAM